MFVNGPVSCDEQAANVTMERLSRRPCTYVTRLVPIAPSLKDGHASSLVCWYYVNKFLEQIKFQLQNTFVSRFSFVATSSRRRFSVRPCGTLGVRFPSGILTLLL